MAAAFSACSCLCRGAASKFVPRLLSVRVALPKERDVAGQRSIGVFRAPVIPESEMETHRSTVLNKVNRMQEEPSPSTTPEVLEGARHFQYVHPEFLPDSRWYYRDKVREKLERQDMMKRRAHFDIPEFYVGSILAVTYSDPDAAGRRSRFVGICIQRGGIGLRHNLTLRNFIGDQGVEVMFELYNPTLLEIQVLRLEKRLDEELFYLRDAPPEHSTVPFDMLPVPRAKGSSVPVNTIKVKLGPRPWHERWERKDLKGVQDLGLPERFYKRAKELAKPWEKFDLMKQYREDTTTDEDLHEVYLDVSSKQHDIDKQKKAKLQRQKSSSKDKTVTVQQKPS